jgi:hypothetical protein
MSDGDDMQLGKICGVARAMSGMYRYENGKNGALCQAFDLYRITVYSGNSTGFIIAHAFHEKGNRPISHGIGQQGFGIVGRHYAGDIGARRVDKGLTLEGNVGHLQGHEDGDLGVAEGIIFVHSRSIWIIKK